MRQLAQTRAGASIAGILAVVASVVAACGGTRQADATQGRDTVRVAVAANFAMAHDTLAAHFQAETGIVVVATLGSTGQHYAQIVNGAPIDVFLSADRDRPALLERDGAAVQGSRFTYAEGRLAIYAPRRDGVIDAPGKLTNAAIRHIAIASPETAPYGAAAMEVLSRWGVAGAVERRLVRGESIAQTMQFVESGAAEAGFVALAQVIRKAPGTYWLVPDSLHTAIAQDAVLLARAKASDAARRYLAYLRGPEGRQVIEAFGYTVRDTIPGKDEPR